MLCPSCGAENEEVAEVCFGCRAVLSAITLGTVIASRYEIVQQLGRGGMGVVYKARDRVLDELVALKLLRTHAAENSDAARRFLSEIKLARKITHPNVCRIHDYGEEESLRYISMELVEGTDVKRLIRMRGPFSADEAFSIAVQIGQGLQAIHRVGVVHRDLKTPNIMLDSQRTVRLMDFGIAKSFSSDTGSHATATGLIVGTPEYMSPEQARGERIDARSDIYAFGVVVYELFTGDVPFRGDTPLTTMLKHIEQQPPLDSPAAARIPRALVPMLRRALAKNPAERFGTADDITEAILTARAASVAPPVPGIRAAERVPASPRPVWDARNPPPAQGAAALAPVLDFDAPTETTPTSVPQETIRRPARADARSRPPTAPLGRAARGRRRRWVVGAAVTVTAIASSVGLMVFRGGLTTDPAAVSSLIPSSTLANAPALSPAAIVGHAELGRLDAPAVREVERPGGAAVRVRWESVPGAAYYHVMVDRDAAFGSPILDQSRLTVTQAEARDLQPGVYYWRVAAADRRGTEGPFSGPARFVVTRVVLTPPAPRALTDRQVAPPVAITPRPRLETPLPTTPPPAVSGSTDARVTAMTPPTSETTSAGGMAHEPSPTAREPSAPPAPTEGLLKIGVRPYAEVYVDGRPLGSTPMRPVRLATGTYVVRLSHPSYRPLMRKVTIRAGETKTLEVDLTLDGVPK